MTMEKYENNYAFKEKAPRRDVPATKCLSV